MPNPMKFATNPLLENTDSMAHMMQTCFNPTKAQIAYHNKKSEETSRNIQAAIVRLKSEGKW